MDNGQNKETIEFQEIKSDSSQSEITRKSYRVPAKERKDFSVTIEGTSYSLRDINTRGVGFPIESDSYFPKGMILSSCDLNLPGTSIKGLEGEIVHTSPDKVHGWVCGIRWLKTSTDEETKIVSVVQGLKKELFENGNLLSDMEPDILEGDER
mgnify:CR=1 FL=1